MFTLRAQRVKLLFDLHLCSRMRFLDFYYTMVIVCCQVFVTCFLKVFLSRVVMFDTPLVWVVSIGAVVLGARRVFGRVGCLGFCV